MTSDLPMDQKIPEVEVMKGARHLNGTAIYSGDEGEVKRRKPASTAQDWVKTAGSA
jgi:hypothetical protein